MTLRRPSISPEEAACFLMTACAQQAGVAPARVSVAELPPARALGGHAPRCLSAASAPPGAGCLARRSGWPGRADGQSLGGRCDGAASRARCLCSCFCRAALGCVPHDCCSKRAHRAPHHPATPGVCTAAAEGWAGASRGPAASGQSSPLFLPGS